MVFQCINIRQVPLEVLKTVAFGLGFQHLPRDLANVNAWKTMLDPYTDLQHSSAWQSIQKNKCISPWKHSVGSWQGASNEYCNMCFIGEIKVPPLFIEQYYKKGK